MSEKEHLVLIAVGPVQEFIASGRMLRDLWCGSHLLSDLSGAVAKSLRDQGCRLIFPALQALEPGRSTPDVGVSVANKLLAVTNADPEQVIAAARRDFFHHWKILAESGARKLPASCLRQDIFDAQLCDFGEFYGCWVLLDGDYADARRRLEQVLAGRKCLRAFAAPGWEGAGLPKSSLDGIRESVIRERAPLEKRFILKKGEHLDCLGIVKRMVPHMQPSQARPHFDNLAQVAVRSYLDGLAKDETAKGILQVLREIDLSVFEGMPECRHGYDFLPERFPVELFLPSELEAWTAEIGGTGASAAALMRKTLKRLKDHTRMDPQPYCCLLVGDGDHMGRTLDLMKGIDAHIRFSRELDGFASGMARVVETFGGRLIYSGGDDVMAYVPLHTALACAAKIRADFESAMKKTLAGSDLSPPTFSMGIAIVHHRVPLHRAIEMARKAERSAKEKGGRAALAIIQAKRGGSPVMICDKWTGTGGRREFADRLDFIAGLYRDGALSSRLGYQLRRLAGECGSLLEWREDETARFFPANSAAAETLRLVCRKRRQDGADLDEAHRRTILEHQTDLTAMADELVLAHQFAGAGELAEAAWLTRHARSSI